MNIDTIRDLIYKKKTHLLLSMFRDLDKARIYGSPVDPLCVGMMRTYLLNHYPLWFISGHYRGKSSVPMSFKRLNSDASDFMHSLVTNGDDYLCNIYHEELSYGGGKLHFKLRGVPLSYEPKESITLYFYDSQCFSVEGHAFKVHGYGVRYLKYYFRDGKVLVPDRRKDEEAKKIYAKTLRCIAMMIGKPDFFEKSITDDMVNVT